MGHSQENGILFPMESTVGPLKCTSPLKTCRPKLKVPGLGLKCYQGFIPIMRTGYDLQTGILTHHSANVQ